MRASTVEIVPATPDHAADLAPRLRALDRAEIDAASGRAPDEVLARSVERAVWARAALLDGRPVALWGLGTLSLMFGPGVPWMLGSDALATVKKDFLRESRCQVAAMLGDYDVLTNCVDARNTPAIAYLKWLGFRFEAPTPWGHAGLPFHRFTMERAEGERPDV